MPAISYSVTATLPDRATADEYIAWLKDGHLDQVINHGADSAMIIRLTDPHTPIQVESRYTFPDRQAFDRYVSLHAPSLRADGLRRFPSDRGIRFDRRTGEVL
jgi:hypothetical protein